MLPNGPLTVLCVEDDPDILQLLAMAIDLEPDFELAATATDASTVLDLVRVHHPDVIILDHVPPAPRRADPGHTRRPSVESGLDLITGTRAIVPDAIIVMFSGCDSIQPADSDAGADLYITKPDLDKLLPAIRQLRSST